MRRRRAATAAALCLLALAAAACTGGGGGGRAAQPTTTGGGEIIVASGLDVTGSDGVRQQLIEQWNGTPEGRRHPARLVELPGEADQQRSQLLGALQSGSSAYDVVNLDVTWVPEFAQAGLISPLDHQMNLDDGDVIPSVAGTARWDGHTYAAPFNSDVGLLYYRADTIKAIGIDPASFPKADTTWQELQTLISDVDADKDHQPKGYMAGWTSQLGAYEGLTVNAIEAFASVGVQLADAEGHYTADPAKLRAALSELKSRAGHDETLPEALTSDESTSLGDFAAGHTVFLRHWPYAYGALSRTFGPSRMQVARLPGKAVLGGQNLAVAAGSPRAKYALDLVKYLTDAQSERCLLDAGFAATRESAYKDAKVRCTLAPGTKGSGRSGGSGGAGGSGGSPSPGASASSESLDMPRDADGRPAYAASTLLPALTQAVQRPRTPYYGALTQLLQAQLHDWISDTGPFSGGGSSIDPGPLADSLDRSLAKILKGK
ncbi:extracellular solute-binding protein [Streptomyces sp. NPDC087422]|uniref:extracellular solute-binding protein n=1 Tax=Streptomyces sp. NPDC087422 TaxID=3365786 RepID=UPI0038216275